MIGIALRFTSGRFHATPWGRHVNEGAPEWPPSPWRILRALVATWKRKLNDQIDQQAMQELLQKLASPPVFALPPATTGHSRHYMPWFKKGPDDRTLVFDTFVAVSKQAEVVAIWPDVDLTDLQREVLSTLMKNIGFLGRSESWCDGQVLDDAAATGLIKRRSEDNASDVHWSQPLDDHSQDSPALAVTTISNQEIVRVLCADAQTAFEDEHVTRTETITTGRGRNKQTETARLPLYDPNWHLCMETAYLHQRRWSDPPGSRWVQYTRPMDCFRVRPRAATIRSAAAPRRSLIVVARYVLDGPALPLITETLAIAESARFTLMGLFKHLKLEEHYGRGKIPRPLPPGAPRFRSEVFSGKDAEGNYLRGHQHAWYVPTDEDGDGRIDHLTIYAEMGFGSEDPLEIQALDRFRRLKRQEGESLNLLLIGLGTTDNVIGPMFVRSKQWVSATPFLVTRHPKKNGRKRDPQHLLGPANQAAFVEHNLREELARFLTRRHAVVGPDNSDGIRIEGLVDEQGAFRVDPSHWFGRQATGSAVRPIQFKRFRRKPGDDGGKRPAGAFRIEFAEPIRGPLCLGQSAHFGLGLFLPADSTVLKTG